MMRTRNMFDPNRRPARIETTPRTRRAGARESLELALAHRDDGDRGEGARFFHRHARGLQQGRSASATRSRTAKITAIRAAAGGAGARRQSFHARRRAAVSDRRAALRLRACRKHAAGDAADAPPAEPCAAAPAPAAGATPAASARSLQRQKRNPPPHDGASRKRDEQMKTTSPHNLRHPLLPLALAARPRSRGRTSTSARSRPGLRRTSNAVPAARSVVPPPAGAERSSRPQRTRRPRAAQRKYPDRIRGAATESPAGARRHCTTAAGRLRRAPPRKARSC